MDQLSHFSHEHPLIFNEARDIEDEINRDHFCSIRNIPILLSSFYSCSTTDCMYLLHKSCALLPETMTHPWFPSYHFRLEKMPPDHYSQCRKCRQPSKNFAYIHASDPKTTFHPTCGVVLTSSIESMHKSHPLHPLVAAVGKRTSAVCEACAKKQKGDFFMCQPCNFLIHVDCALLPRIIKCRGHRHYLILSYSSTDSYQSRDFYAPSLSCLICSKDMFGSGAYSCGNCNRFAHLRRAIKDMENVGTERNLGVVYLPVRDPGQIIPYILERNKSTPGRRVSDHHEHQMILYNNDTETSNKEAVALCNACIGPIYPPFYGCVSQSSACNFHLHQPCSDLPSRRKLLVDDDGHLRYRGRNTLCSLFYCLICFGLGNGFCYQLDDFVKTHITCSLLDSTIKHASHKQHCLRLLYAENTNLIKRCCSDETGPFLHRCLDCDFVIDYRCAFLPAKIKHKYDKHPLDLITTCIASSDDEDKNICEFCEEHIDTRFWYYGCEECDNLFHVKCIPSAGSLSKVKFGNSIDVSCHPPHPVTFVRMLGFGSQNCGYCDQIVEGFVDEMAFHCEKCDFWMHFKCAEECTGTQKLRPPECLKYYLGEHFHRLSINMKHTSKCEIL